MILSRLARRVALPRPRFNGTLPVLVAHAVAFSAVAHCHYWMRPPTRLESVLGEFLLGSLLWLPARKLVPRIADRVRQAEAGRLVVAVGIGLTLWWQGQAADTLWVHDPRLWPVLAGGLFAAHAIVAALLFAGLLVFVAATDGPTVPPPPSTPLRPRDWFALPLFAVAAVAVAAWYVAQERTIYLADWMYQWTLAADWGELLRRSVPEAWYKFRVSVQNGGYTLLPGAPAGVAMAVLGDSRFVYVGSVAAVYLPATYAAAAWFVRKTSPVELRRLHLFAAVFLLTMPLAWLPVVQGYPDLGGVPLAVVSLWLVAGRPRDELRWPHLFGAAAVLVAMILFRRWYSFWAVGLMAVALADGVLAAVPRLLARKPREAWQAIRPGLAVPALFAVLLLSVAWPMIPSMAGMNPKMLAAYRHPGTLAHRLWLTGYVIGFGYLALSGGAAAYLLCVRQTRRPVLFLLGVTAVMVPLFYRMQDPNRHHEYLALPLVLLLPALAGGRAVAALPRAVAALVLLAVAALGTVNLLGSVDPNWKSIREEYALLASNSYFPPAVRSDRAEFERVLQFLTDQTNRTGKPFVVLSSSLDLHSTVFQSAERSLGVPFPAAALQLPTADIDQVFGFPDTVFQADLILVADPPQFIVQPEEQQTLLLPCRLLMNREGIGASFEKLQERFALQNGVTATFYRRARPIPAADFRAFCERLRQAHPDNPLVYQPRWPADELTKMP